MDAWAGVIQIGRLDGAVVIEEEDFFLSIIPGVVDGAIGEGSGFCCETLVDGEPDLSVSRHKLLLPKCPLYMPAFAMPAVPLMRT